MLPRKAVDVSSPETFIVRLDRDLSNLIHLKMSLLTAKRLGLEAFKGSFLHKLLCSEQKYEVGALGQYRESSWE